MKKLAILTLFISTISFGQFFQQDEPANQGSNQENSLQPYDSYEYTQGTEDTEPNPGDVDPQVPLDNWLFLLPLAGIAVGAYFLSRKQKAKI